ncbi:MAG: response regulator [Planctomycetota bacterium]|jgi:CheY-like chemotaxis protein|nr:response regulator [Planctomycetota bacterium]
MTACLDPTDDDLLSQLCQDKEPGTVVHESHESSSHLPRSGDIKRASERFLAQPKAQESRDPARATPKLLLIDDDLMLRNVTAMVLRHHGYEVITALGPESAELAVVNDVNLVITDLIMPGYSGLELIEALHRHLPGVPIIAISGGLRGNSEDYLNHARDMGVDAALAKPFRMPQLIEVIEDLLKQRAERA